MQMCHKGPLVHRGACSLLIGSILLVSGCGSADSNDQSVAAGSPRATSADIAAAAQDEDSVPGGLRQEPSLPGLLASAPALSQGRWPTPPERLESVNEWPNANVVTGEVVSIEVTLEDEVDGVSAARLYYTIGIDGSWRSVETGLSVSELRYWKALAWAGPSDSAKLVQAELANKASAVAVGSAVVLVTVPNADLDGVIPRLGLLEHDGSVRPLTIGGPGAMRGFTTLEQARRELDALIE